MKNSEAKKAIETLSSKYSIDMKDTYFNVNYNREDNEVAYVDPDYRYVVNTRNRKEFSKLPFSNKLYMTLSELAMTPLDERVEEKKYQVKAFGNYLNINVGNNRPSINTSYESSAMHTEFTLKEIEQLKQREDIPLDWKKVTLEEANED